MLVGLEDQDPRIKKMNDSTHKMVQGSLKISIRRARTRRAR